MNATNFNIAKNMNKREYVSFLKEALGFSIFLNNQGMKIQGSRKKRDAESGLCEFAILKDSQGVDANAYFLSDDSKQKLEFYDAKGKVYNTETFFDKIFDDSILFCLLIASKKQKTPFVYDEIIKTSSVIDEESMREMLDMEVETRSILKKKELKRYRFIIGAGINSKLGPKSWGDLINDMRYNILELTPLSERDLDVFKEKICNTTYVIPQMLKDLDEKVYFNVLSKSMYDGFEKNNISIKMNPQFENTTIYQIARILASNVEENRALTFNYDDILEMVLDDNLGIKASSIFKGYEKVTSFPIIYHPHGFWPYSAPKTKIHKNSIVLSSIEYMENYQTLKAYSAKKLNKFIDDTCILVGNSLSDYEEQKIFKRHHEKNIAEFSFLFLCENNVWKRKYYLVYFLRMGVIPVFFKSFDEMTDFLKTM